METFISKRGTVFLCVLAVTLVTARAQRDFGVDVSHFQGESGISSNSWIQMASDGKSFAFIKATEGLTGPDDAAMANNMIRATAAGLRAGIYHYAHPENRPTTNGAILEADHLLTYAGNFIGPGYLAPVIDVEFSASALDSLTLTAWVMAFSDRIIANRGPSAAPIIYCDQYFAHAEFDSRVANYPLWLRTIGGNPTNGEPPIVSPYTNATGVFSNWSFWQYSASGSSGGISPLDLNVCHNEYTTLDSFLILTNPSPVIPAIATQPQSQTVTIGANATFNVTPTVSSSTPLSYQWRFNGTNIPSATLTAYTRTNSQTTDAGNYTVVLTNAAGSVTSAIAVLSAITGIPVYQESFDGYASPSILTNVGVTNGFKVFYGADSNSVDFKAIFGFDYSTVTQPTTIPSAPHSTGGTTKGLYLTVNKDLENSAAAVNLYPLSQFFTNNFSLKFDLWINWLNVSGSTEHALFGINHSGNTMNRVSQSGSDGLFFAVDGDGGVSATSTTLRDFAVFQGSGGIPALKTTGFGPTPPLGAQFDNANSGFVTLFPSKSAGFTTPGGSAGLGWVSVEVRQQTNLITWYLNDTVVAQYTNFTGFTNGNVMLGYSDAFPTPGSTNNFVLFDNIRVEVPSADADNDGMPDTWEIQYFGNLNANANDDADGDGATNLGEYLAGTGPTNPSSVLHFLSAIKTNNDVRLEWATVGGHSYVLQFLTNSTGSIATNFTDLSPVIPMSGTGEGATNFLHVGGASNSAAYYRVRLSP